MRTCEGAARATLEARAAARPRLQGRRNDARHGRSQRARLYRAVAGPFATLQSVAARFHLTALLHRLAPLLAARRAAALALGRSRHRAARAADAPVLLVVGDSISAGYGLAGRHRSGSTSWRRSSRREGYRYRVVNASISGDTTAGGRARLPALLAQHKPAIVVIELGGNDALRGGKLATTRDNLDAMVAAAQARRREGADRRHEAAAQLRAGVRARVRRAVRRASRRRARLPLVPFFFEGFGEDLALFQPDRIHPTAEAQPLLLDNVWPPLQPLLRKRAMTDATARRSAARSASPSACRASRTRIDVRSPSEFAETTSRARSTCRCSTTRERARSRHAARAGCRRSPRSKLGAAIVARNIARILETHCRDKPRDWAPLVYCWRGGKRSRSLAHVLNEIGWRAVQLEGGYRAYRRHVVATLAALPPRFRYRVVCGLTGSGKSRLLAALARRRRAGARPRGARASSRIAAGRSPRRPAAVAEGVRQPAARRARSASIRRVRSSSNRRAARSAPCSCPTRCSPRCAARRACASTRRSRCASRC